MIRQAHLLIMIAVILVAAALGAVCYSHIPDPAPMHWNIRGEVDGYGPRWLSAFLMPLVTSGIVLLLVVLPLLGPFRTNFEQFKSTYGKIGITIVTTFFAIHVVLLMKSMGRPFSIGPAITIVMGLTFAFMGNWIAKVRRNFYVGIRTPWTLANETVWERTHRAGAKVMVGMGFVLMAAGLFTGDVACFVVLMSCCGALALWSILYSLILYRRLGQRDDLSSSA